MPLLVILYIYITQDRIDTFNTANSASLDRGDVILFMLDILGMDAMQDDLFEARKSKVSGVDVIASLDRIIARGSGRLPAQVITDLQTQRNAVAVALNTAIGDSEAQTNAAAIISERS